MYNHSAPSSRSLDLEGTPTLEHINTAVSRLEQRVRAMESRFSSSPVRSKSRRRGLSWTMAEKKIRKLHRAALDDVTEEKSRRLYSLELSASRHAGTSPRALLEKAKALLR